MESEGGAEHHHHGEKKSVLKKVKDKAKKIKDTIKKHGHGHGQDHDHQNLREDDTQQGYEEESEDDEDEEIANDPEFHGAPMYESSAIRRATVPINLEKPTDRREDRFEHNVTDQGLTRPLAPGAPMEAHVPENRYEQNVKDQGLTRPLAPGPPMEADLSGNRYQHNVKDQGMTTGPPMEGHVPENKTSGVGLIGRNMANVEEPKTKIEPLVGLEEDPHAPYNSPASNHQSKVIDPTATGGKEANVGPLAREFDNLNVHDAPMSKPVSEQTPLMGIPFNPEAKPENTDSNPKVQDSHATEDTSIAGKISSATYSVANRAASAKDMVASKLGYGGAQQEGHDSPPKKPITESASEYAHKVAESLAPVYGKVADAGTAVMSKVHGSAEGGNGGDDSVSAKGYWSEKLRPGDEDKALSEVITNALQKKKGEEKKVGKVTVSKEVEARLGTNAGNKREGEDAVAAGQESVGQGMVDRLRDAVGSWLGKSTGVETAKESVGKSYVSDATSASKGVGSS